MERTAQQLHALLLVLPLVHFALVFSLLVMKSARDVGGAAALASVADLLSHLEGVCIQFGLECQHSRLRTIISKIGSRRIRPVSELPIDQNVLLRE